MDSSNPASHLLTSPSDTVAQMQRRVRAVRDRGGTTACTEEIAEMIARDVARGGSVTAAAASHGVRPDTLRLWMTKGLAACAGGQSEEDNAYALLYIRLTVAEAQARLGAEHRLAELQPERWLAYMAGVAAREGPLVLAAPRAAEQLEEMRSPARLREVMAALEELKAFEASHAVVPQVVMSKDVVVEVVTGEEQDNVS